jgi:hypothetical protein
VLHKVRIPLLLVAGDVLTLLLFVAIGQREHEMLDASNPLRGLLLSTAIFGVPWVLAGLLLGAYPGREKLRFLPFMGRSLNLALVALPLGVLLRSYVLGRAVIPTVFISAALGFGGVMMLGWRAAYAGVLIYLTNRRSARPEHGTVMEKSLERG